MACAIRCCVFWRLCVVSRRRSRNAYFRSSSTISWQPPRNNTNNSSRSSSTDSFPTSVVTSQIKLVAMMSRAGSAFERYSMSCSICACNLDQTHRKNIFFFNLETLHNIFFISPLLFSYSRGKRSSTRWGSNFWLDLDFSVMSRAALDCSSHFTTILFAEIWCNMKK